MRGYRLVLALAIAGAAGVTPAAAAPKTGMLLWNLTGETLNRVQLAPSGSKAFGKNQCQNDKDGEVDFDEKLPISDVKPGRYDIRVRDVHGRTCLARDIEVKADATFVVHEKDLTACSK